MVASLWGLWVMPGTAGPSTSLLHPAAPAAGTPVRSGRDDNDLKWTGHPGLRARRAMPLKHIGLKIEIAKNLQSGAPLVSIHHRDRPAKQVR